MLKKFFIICLLGAKVSLGCLGGQYDLYNDKRIVLMANKIIVTNDKEEKKEYFLKDALIGQSISVPSGIVKWSSDTITLFARSADMYGIQESKYLIYFGGMFAPDWSLVTIKSNYIGNGVSARGGCSVSVDADYQPLRQE